jgi:peroxiredoxin|tara:strand:+ start:232045 stop:233484 length:1440 start_codon:yes stop_codon:yes gene_type:complete
VTHTFVLNQIVFFLKKHLLLFLLTLAIVSCNNKENTIGGDTWLGGEIVNPKSDYVIITRNNNVLDTIKLDENNYFSYQIENPEKGIYFFNHNEYQAVYIEPGDSILLRVNTIEFDESLSFSGQGGYKNNLLMSFFLLNEQEAPLLARYNQLPPVAFEAKLDSLKNEWESVYESFLEKNNTSKTFRKVAKSNIDYIYNMRKELYTSAHANNSSFNKENFPKDFYDYRENINFGDELLRTYYPYYRFLNFYLDNVAHNKKDGKGAFNRFSFAHNYAKINAIDSIITNDSLKNDFLKYNVRRYLLNAKNAEEEQRIVALFDELSTNESHKKRIGKLAEATMQLTSDNKIPDLPLVTTDNTVVDLLSTINKKSVIYFWSMKSVQHYKSIHIKVAELKSKYPEYNYIGINTDTHYKKWLNIVKRLGYNLNNEYQFDNIEVAEKKLVLTSVHKALIVDKDGVIIEGNTNLLSPEIEQQLLGYINK